MRYLVFGDVHGNLPALEKMLAHENGNFDHLISHGDVVNYGPWSNECVALLKTENCICLQGNHEEYFINGTYPGRNLVAKSFFDFCFPKFESKNTIAGYSLFYDVPEYRVIHSIKGEYFFPDTDFSSFTFDRNYIFGHSHYQFHKKVNNYNLYNTGSVGQNRKYINQICYLVLDTENKTILLKTLEYNVDILIDQMRMDKYPQICLDYYSQKKRI
jgi:predicted phosphodiesterase